MPEPNKDGENLNHDSNNGENGSVVSKILSRLPEVDPEETKKKEEPETSKEETKVEPEKETSKEKTDSKSEEEAIVIKPDENVVVTEEIAEAFGLEEGYIGKTVTFTAEEIAEANKDESAAESEEEEIITAKRAEQLGLPNTFIGKPLSEAGKAYKNAVKWESENNRQIKDLQKTKVNYVDSYRGAGDGN